MWHGHLARDFMGETPMPRQQNVPTYFSNEVRKSEVKWRPKSCRGNLTLVRFVR